MLKLLKQLKQPPLLGRPYQSCACPGCFADTAKHGNAGKNGRADTAGKATHAVQLPLCTQTSRIHPYIAYSVPAIYKNCTRTAYASKIKTA